MRVLVCGSRTFEDRVPIETMLHGYHDQALAWDEVPHVIEGGAKGADSIAGAWADSMECPHEQYPADWGQHGKRAGFIRNQQMLDEGKPDVVWAFVDKPLRNSRGTADMVRRARNAQLPTYVVEVAS
jgi:hypothetical protein